MLVKILQLGPVRSFPTRQAVRRRGRTGGTMGNNGRVLLVRGQGNRDWLQSTITATPRKSRRRTIHHSASSCFGLAWKFVSRSARPCARPTSWANTKSWGKRASTQTKSPSGDSGWHEAVIACEYGIFLFFSYSFLRSNLGFLMVQNPKKTKRKPKENQRKENRRPRPCPSGLRLRLLLYA